MKVISVSYKIDVKKKLMLQPKCKPLNTLKKKYSKYSKVI